MTTTQFLAFCLLATSFSACSRPRGITQEMAPVTQASQSQRSMPNQMDDRIPLETKVEKADLILTAEIDSLVGSRMKHVRLRKVKVIKGVLNSEKELIVHLRQSPLTLNTKEKRWIFFLLSPMEKDSLHEHREIVGKGFDFDGMELASEENLRMVQELIRRK